MAKIDLKQLMEALNELQESEECPVVTGQTVNFVYQTDGDEEWLNFYGQRIPDFELSDFDNKWEFLMQLEDDLHHLIKACEQARWAVGELARKEMGDKKDTSKE